MTDSREFREPNLNDLANHWSVNEQWLTNDEKLKKAVNDFFRLQESYLKAESKRRKSSKNANGSTNASAKAKCIVCKHPGQGTIFTITRDKYHAICGAEGTKCKLDLLIHKGEMTTYKKSIESDKKRMETVAEKIVRLEMDTLFGLIDEKDALVRYKRLMHLYNQYSLYFNTFTQILENSVISSSKKYDRIQYLKNKINVHITQIRTAFSFYKDAHAYQHEHDREYQYQSMHENNNVTRDTAEIYVNEIMPSLKELQSLQYEIMEMIENDGVKKTATLNMQKVSLKRQEIWLRDYDTSSVVNDNVKNK